MVAFDRTSRGGLRPIYERAHENAHFWTNELEAALLFNRHVLSHYEPAIVDLRMKSGRSVLLYSDAEWELKYKEVEGEQVVTDAEVGLGGLSFQGDSARAWAGTAPFDFIANLAHRETHIIALELLALCITVSWAEKRNK